MKTKLMSERGMEIRIARMIELTLCREAGHVRTFSGSDGSDK